MEKKSRNKITVIRPELTPEEYERRMQIIKEATVAFILQAEAERRQKQKKD